MARYFKPLAAALITAVIIAAAGLSYHAVTKPRVTPPQVTAPRSLSLSSLVSSLSAKLKTSLPNVRLAATPDTDNTAGYQLPGYNFQVILPTSANSVTFNDQQAASESDTYHYLDSAAPTIGNYLRRQGFKPIPGAQPAAALLSAINFYQTPASLCQVTIYTSLDITCAPLDELANLARQAQPLVSEYLAAAPGAGMSAVAAPLIRSSHTPGYSLASLNIYNAGQTKANYYKPPGGNWQLFNLGWYNDPGEDANITPNCQDFESLPAVRAAFQGQACYDSARRIDSTVQ